MENLYKCLSNKIILSLDVFDTLIFRCVKKPTDLFVQVSIVAKQRGYLSCDWNDYDFKHARMEAERLLYKDGKEPTLEEIYQNLRIKNADSKKIQEIEIEIELENCFANHKILNLMEYAFNQNIKVVMVSDMYLKKEHIMHIMENCGIPICWIEDVFVSSEYQVSKHSGGLYDVVLDKYHINPCEMIHVGDNFYSDVVMAKEKGIEGYHYSVLENIDTSLFMDNIVTNNVLPELHSLRNLISSCVQSIDEEKRKWVRFGLDNLGPFFTYGIEWILDLLEREEIYTIYPLMREGELYQYMLKEAVKYREKKIDIHLFYSSRNSMFLSQFDQVESDVVENIYDKACKEEVNVQGLFELFHVEECYPETLRDIKFSFLSNLKKEQKTKVLEFLCSDEMLDNIKDQVEKAKESTRTYLKKMGMYGKRFATLDFGYKATTQSIIEGVLKQDCSNMEENLHLLFLQSKAALGNIQKGTDIRGFISIGEFEEGTYAAGLRDGILEALQMRGAGCTMGYSEDGMPILSEVQGIDEEQFEHICWIHEGILMYQKLYLKYYYKNKMMQEVKYKGDDLYKRLCRCVLFPTRDEADVISSVRHEDTFGNALITKIMSYEECAKKDWKSLRNLRYDGRYRPWHPGLFVQKNPLHFVKSATAVYEEEGVEGLVESVAEAFEDGVKSVIVAGAGLAGERVFRYCKLSGIEVVSFTDGNKKLHGTKKFGIPISGIDQLPKPHDFIIASVAHRKAIEKEIREKFGENVRIY